MATPEEWKTIGISRKTVPDRVEARWARDMPAYHRLRKNGLQPRNIDGCGDLETRSADRLEVEMGHVFPDRKAREEAKAGMRMAEDIQLGLA